MDNLVLVETQDTQVCEEMQANVDPRDLRDPMAVSDQWAPVDQLEPLESWAQ